ncbi:MAG: A/G-specific adenine glycosylase [Desulfobulbaceae bacterium]|nr:A/G-specific adenine glycosylase [Desulfobulbaceae bacterium]
MFSPPDAVWRAHFQNALLAWFATNRRPLPWRQDYLPYHVWIAEVMLQQTRMSRGVAYFHRWVARFPDVAAVASASRDDLLHYWEGLGYYSRLDNLRRAAQAIMAKHGGQLPDTPEKLLRLPGIGRYTAAAVAAIAFGRDVAAVDANVARVFARLFDLGQTHDHLRRRVEQLAAALLPSGQARDYNQALMEFGALLCLPRRARCEQCPFPELCLAKKRHTVAERPAPRPKIDKTDLLMAAAILRRPDGRVLLRKRPATGMWAGLWEFPGLIHRADENENAVSLLRRELPGGLGLTATLAPFASVSHCHTRYRVLLDGYLCYLIDGIGLPPLVEPYSWVDGDQLATRAMSAGHRRLAALLVASGII